MDVTGEYVFDAPQELTWSALQNPEVLGSVMPGGEDFKEVGENEYRGLMNIKIGPVQGKFTGTIKLTDIVEPESYNIQVDGKGASGFVKANGSLKLTGQGDSTHMSYQGTAQVGGRIASVGQRLLESSAKSIIRQSLEGMNEYLKMQAASTPSADAPAPATPDAEAADGSEPVKIETQGSGEASTYTPPSQTNVALNVFKDVLGDVVPVPYRPVLYAAIAIVVILILYLILR
ncbi:MAG: SRPBCC domain-containing protein [Anaerolineales bacterium]